MMAAFPHEALRQLMDKYVEVEKILCQLSLLGCNKDVELERATEKAKTTGISLSDALLYRKEEVIRGAAKPRDDIKQELERLAMPKFPKDSNGVTLREPGILLTPRGLTRSWSLDYDPDDRKWLVMYALECRGDNELRADGFCCDPAKVTYLGRLASNESLS